MIKLSKIKLKKKAVILSSATILLLLLALIFIKMHHYKADTNNPTPLKQLQATPKPNFKPGNTLPRLSYWVGSRMSLDIAKELTKNWGYSLQVDTWLDHVADLDDPESDFSKLMAVAVSDPDSYPIHIISNHVFEQAERNAMPEATWCHIDNPGTVETRSRKQCTETYPAAPVLNEIRQYAVDGVNAAFYKCIQASGAYSHPPTVHQGTNEWWEYITPAAAYALDPITGHNAIWSPLAPTSVFATEGATWADKITSLKQRFPTVQFPVIYNGEEYAIEHKLTTYFRCWKQDPVVYAAVAATGDPTHNETWYEYVSSQKGRQELPIAEAFRAIPDHGLYVAYLSSGVNGRATVPNETQAWPIYGWDFTKISNTSDVPSDEIYWDVWPTWCGTGIYNNWMAKVTNQVGQQIAAGYPLTYDILRAGERYYNNTLSADIGADDMVLTGVSPWVIRGALGNTTFPASGALQIDSEIMTYSSWDPDTKIVTLNVRGAQGTTPASHSINAKIYPIPDPNISDFETYMGFLKIKYALGTIGAAAYAAAPIESDPNWLWQFEELGHVHALYSWLEDYLRDGDLLPGPNMHANYNVIPAYTFPAVLTGTSTSSQWATVVVRKKKLTNDWLICAWIQDKETGGVDRLVDVTIPTLGTVTVNARVAGSVYTATLNDQGQPVLTLVDENALNPTAGISERLHQNIITAVETKAFTYKDKLSLSGTKLAQITKVLVNGAEATLNNNTNTWLLEQGLLIGQNAITIIGQDQSGNSASKQITITRRKPADANGDNSINIRDLSSLMLNWGKVENSNPADFNEDGKVGILDFSALMINWGR